MKGSSSLMDRLALVASWLAMLSGCVVMVAPQFFPVGLALLPVAIACGAIALRSPDLDSRMRYCAWEGLVLGALWMLIVAWYALA